MWELYRYNDLHRGDEFVLHKGQRVYVQAKCRRAKRGTPPHKVQAGETMMDIAQLYGIRLKSLYRLNHMSLGTQPTPGTSIALVKHK